MNEHVANLIARLDQGTSAAEEAALALGLLLERSRGSRRRAEASDLALPAELVDVVLSTKDQTDVVRALVDYLESNVHPTSAAVWALARSRHPRAVSALLRLLQKASDPSQSQLGYQAVVALDDIPTWETWRAIRNAAVHGVAPAKDAANGMCTAALDSLSQAVTATRYFQQILSGVPRQLVLDSGAHRPALRAARDAVKGYRSILFPIDRVGVRELERRLDAARAGEQAMPEQVQMLREVADKLVSFLTHTIVQAQAVLEEEDDIHLRLVQIGDDLIQVMSQGNSN